jgi:acetyl-CoA carboxylase biotin carboxyl carrier protein
MNPELASQLSAWLSATDIGLLELSGPGVHLCLRNEAGRVEAVPPGTAADAVHPKVAVRAESVGRFLHAHPLHEAPLAAPGTPVVRGQAIGLLQVGALLLPVSAPHDGTIATLVADDGSVVGYGALLAELSVPF